MCNVDCWGIGGTNTDLAIFREKLDCSHRPRNQKCTVRTIRAWRTALKSIRHFIACGDKLETVGFIGYPPTITRQFSPSREQSTWHSDDSTRITSRSDDLLREERGRGAESAAAPMTKERLLETEERHTQRSHARK